MLKEENKDNENKELQEKDYAWKDEQERILKKWADKALCLKMMHERAYKRFWCLNAWFNIPVIIISTLTGTGNFASGSFGSYGEYIIFGFGAMNIFAGILATIATYTGVAQKVESHRYCSIAWDKFSRKVQIELAKNRADRVKAKDFIKQAAEEYDRLIEMSPILPNDIIRWFTTMIETGEMEADLNDMETCVHEMCCFPCGCNFCKCFSYCFCCCFCNNNKKLEDPEVIAAWKEIELPEVIGRLKPTEIASELPPETPPPLVVFEDVKIAGLNKKVSNVYDIYNLGSTDEKTN
jgi:CRISPR/Cas system CMR-associated protein Cmr5 small subunit